jgi:putative ABC transport system permease protein
MPPEPGARLALAQQLHETLRATPGVLATGEVSRLPLGGASNITTKLDIERRPLPPDEQAEVDVAIINQVLADRYFAGEDALGQRVTLGGGGFSTIIGIVGSTRYSSLAEAPRPEVYLSTNLSALTAPQLVVRTRGEPQASAAAVRAAIRRVDGGIVIGRVATLEQLRHGALSGPRFNTLLFGVFALLALALSTLGAWGVMAYGVAQRRREIGVRVSLGARPVDVARMILRDGMTLTGIGIAAGIGIALIATRLMASLLYGVGPGDATTLLLVALALLVGATVLAAALASARRATRVDPVRALRADA